MLNANPAQPNQMPPVITPGADLQNAHTEGNTKKAVARVVKSYRSFMRDLDTLSDTEKKVFLETVEQAEQEKIRQLRQYISQLPV